MDLYSIQIAGYSLKVEFRQNDRDNARGSQIELLYKGASVCVWKMIFKNHNTRSGSLSESESLSGG